jgi:hypothetical protein
VRLTAEEHDELADRWIAMQQATGHGVLLRVDADDQRDAAEQVTHFFGAAGEIGALYDAEQPTWTDMPLTGPRGFDPSDPSTRARTNDWAEPN